MPFVGLLIAAIGRIILSSVAFFAAHKLLLAGLVTVVFPIVVNNIIYYFLQKYFGLVQEQLALNLPSGTGGPFTGGAFMIQLTGLAAWVAVKVHLPEALSYVMAATAARFALGFIPFYRG